MKMCKAAQNRGVQLFFCYFTFCPIEKKYANMDKESRDCGSVSAAKLYFGIIFMSRMEYQGELFF
jgi:hypothetical protein